MVRNPNGILDNIRRLRAIISAKENELSLNVDSRAGGRESGSHVTNADWEGVMNSVHVSGSRRPHCYEVGIAWDYKPYLPPHPGDEEEKEETGEENDATSPAAPVAPAVT